MLEFTPGSFVAFLLFIDITFLLKHFYVFCNSLSIIPFDSLSLDVTAVLKSLSVKSTIWVHERQFLLTSSFPEEGSHSFVSLCVSYFLLFLLKTETLHNIL